MRNGGSTGYIVLPMTFRPGVKNKFTLRAFTPEGQPEVDLQPWSPLL